MIFFFFFLINDNGDDDGGDYNDNNVTCNEVLHELVQSPFMPATSV